MGDGVDGVIANVGDAVGEARHDEHGHAIEQGDVGEDVVEVVVGAGGAVDGVAHQHAAADGADEEAEVVGGEAAADDLVGGLEHGGHGALGEGVEEARDEGYAGNVGKDHQGEIADHRGVEVRLIAHLAGEEVEAIVDAAEQADGKEHRADYAGVDHIDYRADADKDASI